MTRPVSLICVQAVFSQRTVFCRARFARAWAARDFRGRRRQGRMSKSSQARRASALHQRQETATPSSEAGRGRSAIGALPLLLPSAGVNHPSASARADAVGCWGSDGLSLCEIAQGFEERPQPACCDGGPWQGPLPVYAAVPCPPAGRRRLCRAAFRSHLPTRLHLRGSSEWRQLARLAASAPAALHAERGALSRHVAHEAGNGPRTGALARRIRRSQVRMRGGAGNVCPDAPLRTRCHQAGVRLEPAAPSKLKPSTG